MISSMEYCKTCHTYYEAVYDEENFSIVIESACRCDRPVVKKLDQAFKQIDKLLQRRDYGSHKAESAPENK